MRISKIKSLIAAAESSVSYYITSTVRVIEADKDGSPLTPQQEIIIQQWKREGKNPAVLSDDMTFKVYRVVGGVRTNFGPSSLPYTFSFTAIQANGADSLLAELTDSSNNVVANLEILVKKKAQDGVTYEIIPTVSAVHADKDGNILTGIIYLTAFKTESGVRTSIILDTIPATGSERYWLQYQIDEGNWEDASRFSVYTDHYRTGVPASAVSTITSGIAFRLRHGTGISSDPVVYQTSPLPVVKDGATGEQGKNVFYYYDGYFVNNKEYTADEHQSPYVAVDWTDTVTVNNVQTQVVRTSYYMLIAPTNKPESTYIAPRTSAAAGIWELMTTDFKWLIAEAIFTNFAKLGAAVFSGNWMISQHGTIDGAASTSYQDFDGSDPTGSVSGNFAPNYAVNLLTGKAYLNDAVIRGTIFASAGEFGGYIKTEFKFIEDSDATVTTDSNEVYYKLNKDLNVIGKLNASPDPRNVIVLPYSSDYIGAEVNIYIPMDTQLATASTVKSEGNDMRILGCTWSATQPKTITWAGGIMTLVGVPVTIGSTLRCEWCMKSFTYRSGSLSVTT